ncbi:enoyl-CoA hydratase/isomerase family protein [Paraburkholderia sp. Tr-20389]|uniref:enoyl-CoA hydratase/isomerase family protein n=1 Tax=Paraburkholderia sp. Tr-20389 TaxID=2703903 RepID=UPI00197E83B4|nr:enoyl-CoA hydratase/isomerase family protein [Paraburkholderia sp. Tr-20389]MBN3753728.1 enoyl-CoA hydratase/isomerase family protein [Paraburkholderia sp. Tr-20389]
MNAENAVLFHRTETTAILTLNRPARLNALTLEMLQHIDQILEEVETNNEISVLVLRSASQRFFCAGADVNEWGAIDPEKMGSRFIRAGNRVMRRIAELDKPTIAVLNGSALGGGLELALSCDLRYALSSIQIGFPEAAVGAIPGWMGCQRLANLVGPARAREMILLGTSIPAATALDWGVVNGVSETLEQLDEQVRDVCALLGKRSGVSMSVAKRLLRLIEPSGTEAAHEFAASVCKATPDAEEGVAAFREKRAAIFR